MISSILKTTAIILCFVPMKLLAQKPETKNATTMEIESMKTVNELTLSAAQKLTDYGLQLSKDRNLKLSVAVVDKSGNLLAFVRMDNAALVTIDVTLGKAKTAAYLKAPSKLFEDFINSGQASMATTPNILSFQGGVPVIYKDEVIGAVGVSGSSGESDNEIATLIAEYLNK